MTVCRGLLAGVVALSLLAAGVAAAAGVASAGHDPAAANFTVTPLEDRSPGATDVTYGQTVVGTAGVDLETLTGTLAVYEAGSWTGCGPTDSEVFGIDRGNTHDGYDVDEGLADNVKRFSAGEDRLETEYNGEDDIGASTHFDDGDQFVAVADCIDNPDAPGWYRITGRTTGVTADGETVSYGGESHYFWICDCEDEAAARRQLGPPPSERGATPTATGTRTSTSTATGGHTGAGDGESTRTATAAAGSTPMRTASATARTAVAPTRTRAGTAAGTPTDAAGSWADVVYRTPTRDAGSGFGPAAALVALLVGAVLVRRRA